ncbi:hypothetical protein GQX74_015506 [Glossina fuscipes]|nr:hypothetical protein GQX74_015506 [Glossina fuscipes]
MLSFAVVISADDDDDDIDDIVVDMAVDVKPIANPTYVVFVSNETHPLIIQSYDYPSSIIRPNHILLIGFPVKFNQERRGIDTSDSAELAHEIDFDSLSLTNYRINPVLQVKLQLAIVSCCRERNLWNILGVIMPEKLLLDKCNILKLATSSFCISLGLRKFSLKSSSLILGKDLKVSTSIRFKEVLHNWSPVVWLVMKSFLDRLEIYPRVLSIDCPLLPSNLSRSAMNQDCNYLKSVKAADSSSFSFSSD